MENLELVGFVPTKVRNPPQEFWQQFDIGVFFVFLCLPFSIISTLPF